MKMPYVLLTLWAAAIAPPRPALRFSPSTRSFKILMLTDLHYGESEAQDAATDRLQAALLAAEQPSLVVFGGDQVSGWASNGSAGFAEWHWRRAVAPVIAAGVPHAAVLGNHDGEADLSRGHLMDLDAQISQTSLTRRGLRRLTGASNYWLDVADTGGLAPAARIWFLDSMDRGCGEEAEGYGCVGADTIEWFVRRASELPPVETQVLFVHIPLPELITLWNSAPTNGSKAEAVCCPQAPTDSGLLAAAQSVGIQQIWSGHDHSNDYVGELGGVQLGYGRKSGYGSYGPPAGWQRGARVIELRLGQPAPGGSTWIRQEDGSREVQGPSDGEAKELKQTACCS